MEKKCPSGSSGHKGLPLKTILLMRFSFAAILLAISLNLSAFGYSQEKVSVNFKKTKLEKALKEIEDRSSYRFVFSSLIIPQDARVTISANDIQVEDLLAQMLSGTGLQFNVSSSGLVVISKDPGFVIPPPVVVKGKIVDESGNPMAGVSVSGKKSKKGTTTDAQGNFTLEVDAGETLEITYVGYGIQTVKVGTVNMSLNINMEKAANDIGEVVVVGYGKDTRKKLTAAVTTIKTDNIVTLPYSNMKDAVAGRVPGVFTLNSGGAPGSAARISIRGGANENKGGPAYVIDGVLYTSDYLFTNLQPNEIENISFLMDAAATAVYGPYGANGVIVVTTRKGKSGKINLNYNYLYEVSEPISLPKLISSYDFFNSRNIAGLYDKLTDPTYNPQIIGPKQMDTIRLGLDPVNWPNTDWYGLALRRYTPQQKHVLDMSGGSEATTYFLSLGYFNQESNYQTNVSTFQRYNARVNVTQKFKKQGLTLGLNGFAIVTNSRNPSTGTGTLWGHFKQTPPYLIGRNPDGTLSSTLGRDNPLTDIDPRSGYNKGETRTLNGVFNADWQVPWVKGLSAGFLGQVALNNGFSKVLGARAPEYDNTGKLATPAPIYLGESFSRSSNVTIQSRIDYSRTFGLHSISATALYEENETKSDFLSGERTGFPSTAVDQLFSGNTDLWTNNGSASNRGRRAYIGRLKYDFASKYIIETSGRYDGSDNFIEGKKWAFFPSVSAAWAISSEKFAQKLLDKIKVDFLKVRASWGNTSNPNLPDFPYLSLYSLNSNVYVVGGNPQTGFTQGPLVDPYLVTWFGTNERNIGVDFNVLKQFNGRFDYFYKRTTGYIVSPQSRYLTPLGTSLPQIKSDGAYRRAGWELFLSYESKVNNGFKYEIGGNVAMYNDLWEKKADEDSLTRLNPYTRTTQRQNAFGSATLLNAGFYQTAQDIINNPRYANANNLMPGDIRYQDMNGDGKIDGNDARMLGRSTFPRVQYGMTFRLNYKAFVLDMLWQGTGTRSVYIPQQAQARYTTAMNYQYMTNFWTPTNTNAMFPRLSQLDGLNGSNNYQTSNFWMYDARYLRLKSLRIAFDAKKQFPKQLGFLNSFVISLNGTNLITFSKVKDFVDPEAGAFDNQAYPNQRVYSLGLSVGL